MVLFALGPIPRSSLRLDCEGSGGARASRVLLSASRRERFGWFGRDAQTDTRDACATRTTEYRQQFRSYMLRGPGGSVTGRSWSGAQNSLPSIQAFLASWVRSAKAASLCRLVNM